MHTAFVFLYSSDHIRLQTAFPSLPEPHDVCYLDTLVVYTQQALPQRCDASIFVADHVTGVAEHIVGLAAAAVHDGQRGAEGRWGQVNGEDVVGSGNKQNKAGQLISWNKTKPHKADTAENAHLFGAFLTLSDSLGKVQLDIFFGRRGWRRQVVVPQTVHLQRVQLDAAQAGRGKGVSVFGRRRCVLVGPHLLRAQLARTALAATANAA